MAYSCRLLTIGPAEMVLAAAKTAMNEIWVLILIIKSTKGLTSKKSNDCDKAKQGRGLKSDEAERNERGIFRV
jgi:hypothetical protein